jgi:hypothetical protein
MNQHPTTPDERARRRRADAVAELVAATASESGAARSAVTAKLGYDRDEIDDPYDDAHHFLQRHATFNPRSSAVTTGSRPAA